MHQTYDEIGSTYGRHRHPDPRWAARIEAALGDATSVANVGAGTGSYEPVSDRHVIAIEPSVQMIRQRLRGSAPVVRAVAEALPLPDASFEAALAVFTTHHWRNPDRRVRRIAPSSGAPGRRHVGSRGLRPAVLART